MSGVVLSLYIVQFARENDQEGCSFPGHFLSNPSSYLLAEGLFITPNFMLDLLK